MNRIARNIFFWSIAGTILLASPAWSAFDDTHAEEQNVIKQRHEAEARFEGDVEARKADVASPDDVIRVVRMTHVGGQEIQTVGGPEAADYARRVSFLANEDNTKTGTSQAGITLTQIICAFLILVTVGISARMMPSRKKEMN